MASTKDFRHNREIEDCICKLLISGMRVSLIAQVINQSEITPPVVKRIAQKNNLPIEVRRGIAPRGNVFPTSGERMAATLFLTIYSQLQLYSPEDPEWKVFITAFEHYAAIPQQVSTELSSEMAWVYVVQLQKRGHDRNLRLDRCSAKHTVAIFDNEIANECCLICQSQNPPVRKTLKTTRLVHSA